MIKGFNKEMPKLTGEELAKHVNFPKAMSAEELCAKRVLDPSFKETLKKFPKGSFENSALKELANLKQVKSAGVLGKVANLIKRVVK